MLQGGSEVGLALAANAAARVVQVIARSFILTGVRDAADGI